ncbi:thiamine biosynthesis protein ThiH [Clostridia bacterium]|nr:thiamine biosynthesis protein ThiH [Clostridia bacterium]
MSNTYFPDMEIIPSDLLEKVLSTMDSYQYDSYTQTDVRKALQNERCTIENLGALLSPAAAPYLEEMADKAKRATSRHFGNTVYLFTPLYLSNYCGNNCVYCGFNCRSQIARKKLTMEEIEHEMKIIAASGIEEVLLLTGESNVKSPLTYIGEAVTLGKKYFRNIGLEIYPVNTQEYHYLHECGADYVTVFQETYDTATYQILHCEGRKTCFPYRFHAQERAILGGMRGVGLSALFGLSDFRKEALASALHVYYLQRKYPAAEYSLSCPRIRPANNGQAYDLYPINEKELCQILCAYRIFLPFVGITVSTRENIAFRNGIVKIAATKVSAGVSTGIGDHGSKQRNETVNTGRKESDSYNKSEHRIENTEELQERTGDEQFEIADERSLPRMYQDMVSEGLQPVLNDYLYV